jgi:hypothetical protein
MDVTITLQEEAIWAARFTCLMAMINDEGDSMSTASRAMVRELFACLSDTLPDDLGVEITITADRKKKRRNTSLTRRTSR